MKVSGKFRPNGLFVFGNHADILVSMKACRDEEPPVWNDLEQAILELMVAVDMLSNAVATRKVDGVGDSYLLVRARKAKLAGLMGTFQDYGPNLCADVLCQAGHA